MLRFEKTLALAICAAALNAAGTARATVLLTETFSYADGELVGATGSPWAASSGTGTGQNLTVASGRVLLDDDRTQDAASALSSNVTSGAIYASFDLTPLSTDRSTSTTGSQYFAHFVGTGGTSTFLGRVAPGIPSGTASGSIRLGASNDSASASAFLDNDLALDGTFKVVLKYDVATEATTLYVNPTSESGGLTISDATDPNTPGTFTSFGLRQASALGDFFIDNLTVATTFAEVAAVPEPAALGLLSLAGLAALRRRRA